MKGHDQNSIFQPKQLDLKIGWVAHLQELTESAWSVWRIVCRFPGIGQ
jgi:hypothetical protein